MFLKQPLFPVNWAHFPQLVALSRGCLVLAGTELEAAALLFLHIPTGSSLPQAPKRSWHSSEPADL